MIDIGVRIYNLRHTIYRLIFLKPKLFQGPTSNAVMRILLSKNRYVRNSSIFYVLVFLTKLLIQPFLSNS